MQNLSPVTTHVLWKAGTITKNASALSQKIDLRGIAQGGTFSLYHKHTGGTIKIEYLTAQTSSATAIAPTASTAIVSSAATTVEDLVSFSPELTPFIQIKVTELNVANVTSIDLSLNTQ
jgi:hypothetical protein